MEYRTPTAEEKTVFVREYLRCRNGKWECIRSHFRRPRQRAI
jgi:hypothetical protein